MLYSLFCRINGFKNNVDSINEYLFLLCTGCQAPYRITIMLRTCRIYGTNNVQAVTSSVLRGVQNGQQAERPGHCGGYRNADPYSRHFPRLVWLPEDSKHEN